MLEAQASVETIRREKNALGKRTAITVGILACIELLHVPAAIVLHRNGASDSIAEALFMSAIFFGAAIAAVLAVWASKLDGLFWKELAAELGYTYTRGTYFGKEPLLFREGHGGHTRHGLSGTIENQAFRLFQYDYFTGYGKNRQTHSYVVFEVVFSGSFPHIYLNNERNKDLSGFKDAFLHRIGLPASFDARFRLYGPKGYEIEVLEVVTPDVLALLMDEGWEHDTEIVAGKVYVFREKPIRSKSDLENELKHLSALTRLLAPKMNRLSLTPIGNLPSGL